MAQHVLELKTSSRGDEELNLAKEKTSYPMLGRKNNFSHEVEACLISRQTVQYNYS